MSFLDLKYDAFGLNINDSSVKIIKLIRNGKKFSIVSYNKTEIKPGIVESGTIKDEKLLTEAVKFACKSVKGRKLKTKYVVASLPEEESFLQVIQMPKMSLDELKSAVIFEAENYIPLPIDQVYLDFEVIVPIKDSLDHTDVLVAATSKKIADSYVSCLKSAGLIPVALEVESQSTLASLIKEKTSEFPVAVIDMHENTANFIVFCGHSIRFTCSIPILKALQPKTKASENFISQIKKYIDFYQEHASHEHLFNPSGIKKIILCGEGSSSKGLQEFLAEKLSVQTELGDPFINFSGAKRRKINPGDFLTFTAALGLAAKGIDIKCEDIDD